MKTSGPSFLIYDSDSNPYGRSYEDWTRLWWKWLVSIPSEKNPALDESGKFCHNNQFDPKVMFLAGTFGGSAIRKCTVPRGKAILFPIINYQCTLFDEPSIIVEKKLEDLCKSEIDKVYDAYATLDGCSIDARKYRIHSSCFTIQIPEDNCLSSPAGMTKMASDGYWLFIEGLSPGNHLLNSFGSCKAGRIKIGCTFELVAE